MEKFKSIPKRVEEEYHTIKDDTPLVNVYTTGEVPIRDMQIPNDLLTDAIRDTQAYTDYVDVEKLIEGEDEFDGDEFADMVHLSDEYSSDKIEPRSHKEKPKEIVDDGANKDDDDKHDDAKDDKNDDDNDNDDDDQALIRTRRMGSSEIKTVGSLGMISLIDSFTLLIMC
nr:hypothetical protein [Tanacetum cinerariifolium]